MRIFAAVAFTLAAPLALAGPQCTDADQSEWQDKEAFQDNLKDEGYKINVFKVTDGNCYEIYGWNKEGQKVEIYYDPVSGNAVKTEIDD
ncbi:PepSY domain-containing protein [Marinimicrobium sp. ARAG 43.8]|uniref:PepSY domain-containing protein n=1 Tax=Marinimicrobium sp. ARAG 43.8 TaxID=3418719 RepID=UPI003CF34389